jgi:hypothetical protein
MSADGESGARRRRRPHPAPEPAADARAALGLAGAHARRALAEALLALRALADAAALAALGRPAAEDAALSAWLGGLEELAATLAAGADPLGGELLRTVLDALDAEIGRWEARAREDGDARAVLRAYLGLREILWEIGVRPPRAEPARGARRKSGARVQRVAVDDAGP